MEGIADAVATAEVRHPCHVPSCKTQVRHAPLSAPVIVPQHVPAVRFVSDAGPSLAAQARLVRDSASALVSAASAMVDGSCSGDTEKGSIVVSLADLCTSGVPEQVTTNDSYAEPRMAAFDGAVDDGDRCLLHRQTAGFGSFMQLPAGESSSRGANGGSCPEADELASEWYRLKALGRILHGWSCMAKAGDRMLCRIPSLDDRRAAADQRLQVRSGPKKHGDKQGLKGRQQGQGNRTSKVVWA